jgi:hypothetical protein
MVKKEKKAFLFYHDYESLFEKLTKIEIADLVMALFAYEKRQILPNDFKDKLDMAFMIIHQNLDRDRENYAETCKKRRIASELGNKVRWRDNPNWDKLIPNVPNGISASQKSQMLPNVADIDSDSENDSDVCVTHTLAEVQKYFQEKNYKSDYEKFFKYNQALGWRNKHGLPIANWQSLADLWEKRESDFRGNDDVAPSLGTPPADISDEERFRLAAEGKI